ncbi:hypothetical protein NESM_000012700 [Novymonas esmeraldas]|uniref:Uncharacterized protein n=1 Tax=Novymonas esmeraldas TaxID=1808958 RepID=A0AAW0F1I3_9TRYP
MGCKASSLKEKEGRGVGGANATAASGATATPATAPSPTKSGAATTIASAGAAAEDASGDAATVTAPANKTVAVITTKSFEELRTSDSIVAFIPVPDAPTTHHAPAPDGATSFSAAGSSANEELNGSFISVDLAGSFHTTYSTKGDLAPTAKVPESRRSRSVSPMLLTAMSSHPSDKDLVLICTDCGMEIDEAFESPLCPLTGKVHV